MSVRWTYIDPTTVFNPFIGFQTVLIALIGGAATLWGPLIAAVVFSLLAETLRLHVPQLYMMSLGLLLILSVLYLPGGLASLDMTPAELHQHGFRLLIDPATPLLAAYEFERAARFTANHLPATNWKLAVDTYLEGYHFASLHPNTVFKTNLSNTAIFDGFGPHERVAFALRTLDDDEHAELLKARGQRLGLSLSTETVYWMLTHLPRDTPSLLAALARIDRAALTARRQPTLPFVRQVLADR